MAIAFTGNLGLQWTRVIKHEGADAIAETNFQNKSVPGNDDDVEIGVSGVVIESHMFDHGFGPVATRDLHILAEGSLTADYSFMTIGGALVLGSKPNQLGCSTLEEEIGFSQRQRGIDDDGEIGAAVAVALDMGGAQADWVLTPGQARPPVAADFGRAVKKPLQSPAVPHSEAADGEVAEWSKALPC